MSHARRYPLLIDPQVGGVARGGISHSFEIVHYLLLLCLFLGLIELCFWIRKSVVQA